MMTRKEIEQAMHGAIRRFAETKDPKAQNEVATLSAKLDTIKHIETLENALAQCSDADLSTPQVYAALAFLSDHATAQWPFDAFRVAVHAANEQGRWKKLDTALNGIKQAVGLVDGEH